ncbi:hypothetical protein F4677DRAFT_298516 [Hypoxylon crocopeplum]|nr:hypothetical protein F4677DRAFT_298516 [Hypoxylon crocopeplum]
MYFKAGSLMYTMAALFKVLVKWPVTLLLLSLVWNRIGSVSQSWFSCLTQMLHSSRLLNLIFLGFLGFLVFLGFVFGRLTSHI